MKTRSLEKIPVTDIFSLYVAEATRTPLLTKNEEFSLMHAIKQGMRAEKKLARHANLPSGTRLALHRRVELGKQARTQLIKANTRLVISVAQRYRGMGMPLADLVQEGNLGLMYAIEKFDHHRGTRFATYATWWIRQHIMRALSNQSRSMRLPAHLTHLLQRAEKARLAFEQKHNHNPTLQEIARIIGVTEHKLERAIQSAQVPISLDSPLSENDGITVAETLADENTPDSATELHQHELYAAIQDVLCSLNIRQAKILALRFGLFGNNPHSRQEIGEKFGLNRERIRQLEVDALKKLRQSPQAQQLQDFLV